MDEVGATGATLGALESALRFRMRRQGVLAGNVANVDTPGYRRSEVEARPGSFDAILDRAGALAADRVRATHPGHIGAEPSGVPSLDITRGPRGDGPDRNGVDFDQEMVQLSRNAGAFTEAAAVHTRLAALLRLAITGQTG